MQEKELKAFKDRLRAGLVKHTRRAFRMLPPMTTPRILDIGCGSGVPTMELAKLSDGEIVAIDVSQAALDVLSGKIKKAGLADRVKAMRCPMQEMDFPDASFDVIWAEGSINAIGFAKGLNEWHRLIKPGGFLVVHDDRGNLAEKRRQVSRCGYELINHFVLSEDVWWNEYYARLEKKFNEIRAKHAGDQNTVAVLNDDQREIDTFKRDPKRYRSVFFIMKKSQRTRSVKNEVSNGKSN